MILLMVDDLLFSSRIREVAKAKEVIITKDFNENYSKAIIDLNAKKFNPFDMIAKVKPGIEIITFFSHVDVDLARKAKEMNVSQVLPRSKFVDILSDIIS